MRTSNFVGIVGLVVMVSVVAFYFALTLRPPSVEREYWNNPVNQANWLQDEVNALASRIRFFHDPRTNTTYRVLCRIARDCDVSTLAPVEHDGGLWLRITGKYQTVILLKEENLPALIPSQAPAPGAH